jgi:hypothetical protein
MSEGQRCARCGTKSPMSGIKFCKECKKAVLRELNEAGYLQSTGWPGHVGQRRTSDQREHTYETKHGLD